MVKDSDHVHPRKRLIVCCDGTWMDSDGDVQIPSNVTRISRCIEQEGVDEKTGRSIPQIVYYQAGVGTEDNFYSKYIGGATGKGLSEHIREAYSFICNNYHNGDEIFLIGFSRGAFTARSISSLIRAVGLLTPAGLVYFYQIFQDWEYQLKDGWKSSYPTQPFPHRPKLNTPEYRRKLLELELTRPDIPIKAVAVWDTVGSLGIPMIALLPQPPSKDFSFVDTKVEPNIEYAFQALALDEHRRSFTPTIWEKDSENAWPVLLKQCWFPGVHSDVGGGYSNVDLANLTLAWMISQLDPLLSFNHGYIVQQNRLSMESHESLGQKVRDWGLGLIHNSMTLFFWLGGKKVRTPMGYESMTPKTHLPSGKRLKCTNETVHSSVRIRMGRRGLGYNDRGTYDSEALQGWTMYGIETTPSTLGLPDGSKAGRMKQVKWVKEDPKTKERLELLEDEIGEFERKIMTAWPEVYEEFDAIRPGTHAASVRRSSTYPNDHPGTVEARGVGAGGLAGGHRHPDRVETI